MLTYSYGKNITVMEFAFKQQNFERSFETYIFILHYVEKLELHGARNFINR